LGAEAGNVVARLAVKVTPDTRDFWGDLSRRLDAIEKRLQPLEVGVELDEGALRERVRVMSERAQAAVRDVQMGVHFDEREFAKIGAMADRLDDAAERHAGTLSKVYDGDMDTIRRHWSASLEAMKRDAAKRLKFKGPHSDEDSYWRGHTESAFRMWYGRRGEQMRRAFRELGPVEFDLRPDDQWQERVRGALDGFFSKAYVGKVKWRVDEDLNDVGALRRLRSRMEREFTQGWKYVVDPDVDVKSGRVDAALNKLRHEMRERAFGKHEAFHLEIKPHMSDHELREVGRKLKHFKRKWDDTELEFKLGLDHSSRYVAAARLAMLARDRWVKLRPVIDHKAMVIARETLAAMSGWRLASDLTHNVWDLVKNLDKMVPLIGAVGAGFAVAGSGVTQLLKHTFTLGGAVGHVLQAAALLGPTLAISAGFIGYTAVQAAKVATEIVPGLEDAFHKMNDAAQHGFWGAVSDEQIAKITDSFFPEMASGFDRLSKAMGGHFGKLVDSFDRVLKPHIAEMFDHSAAGIDKLGEHTDSLMTILGVLGKHGSKTMERFLGWLGEATDKYADWLVEAEKSGRLQEIIDRGIDTLKDFGRAVGSAGGILHGFFKAAEEQGGASMKRFADGLEAVNKVVNGSRFQTGLKRVFWGMSRAWEQFKDETRGVWGEFASSWSHLAAEAGEAMGRVGGKFTKALLTSFSGKDFNKGFHNLFDGLADGLSRIADVWPKVSKGLGSLMSFMGSLGRGLSPVVGAALEALAHAAERLGPALSRVVEKGGPALGSAIESWGKIATPVAEALSKLLDALVRIPGAVEAVATGFLAFRGISSAASLVKALSGALSGLRADSLAAKDALVQFASARGLSAGAGGGLGGGLAAEGSAAAVGRFGGMASKAAGAVRGLAAGAASVIGFLGGPWGLAIAGGVAALGALVSAANQSTDALASDLAGAMEKVANGADKASESVQRLVGKVARTAKMGKDDPLDFSGGGLDGVMKNYRMAPRWMNWLYHGAFGDSFGGASIGGAVSLSDTFDKIGEIAKSGNVAGAAEALRKLRAEVIANGGSVEEWDATLDSALGSVEGLQEGLVEYANSVGAATDKQSLHNLVAGNTDLLWAKMAGDAARLKDNMSTFGNIMDSQFKQWNMGADAATGLHSAIERVGRSMIDVGAAARDANGEVVDSVETVLANLQAQVDAQAQVAQNMLDLASAGFNTQVLEELAKLPHGAQYLQQLKDALADTSDEGRAKLQQLIEATNGIGPALSGMSWSATSGLQAFHNAVTGAFDKMKASVMSSLDSLGADAGLKAAAAGAKTSDELVKALSDAGVKISQTADGWALTLNGQTATFSAAGASAGASFASGFNSTQLSPINTSSLVPVPNWWSSQGQQGGMAWVQGVGQGVAQGGNPFNFGALPAPSPSPADVGQAQGSQYGSGLSGALNAIGVGPMNGLITQWNSMGPVYAGAGEASGTQFGAGLAGTSGLVQASGVCVASAGASAADHVSYAPSGAAAGASYGSGLSSQAGAVYSAASQLVSQAVAGVSVAASRLWSMGVNAGASFASGLMSKVRGAISAAQSMASSAVSAVKSALDINSPSKVFRKIGYSVPEGFAQGIERAAGWATDAAVGMASETVGAARGVLEINSPSKVFRRFGEFIPHGLAGGIRSEADAAVREAEAMAGRVVDAGSGVRMRVFDGGRFDVSEDSRVTVCVDPESLRGARFGLRLSDETELETFISDVADGRVVEYARMGA
jgi:hypothetical protein